MSIGPTGQPAPPAGETDPAWGAPSHREARWPATLALLVALGIRVALPERVLYGPRWLVPALEASLLIPLTVANPTHMTRESRNLRSLSVALIGLVTTANASALGLVVRSLLRGGKAGGRELIAAALLIWVTNVLIFALWYWELDRGGPFARMRPDHRQPDFLFPQMTSPQTAPPGWTPEFGDYLYVSFTNSTAFSPTDTLPLTVAAKALMLVQSGTSLVTVALVAARAVNILS